MSVVSLSFMCLIHPCCLQSAFEVLVCPLCATLTCAGVCKRLMDTLLLFSLSLYLWSACKHRDALCIDFLFSCHFIIVFFFYLSTTTPHLFLFYPVSLISFLTYILISPSPTIHFYASLCPCWLSWPIPIFFPLFHLNFLIFCLIYVTLLGLQLSPPHSSPHSHNFFSFCCSISSYFSSF